MSLSNAWRTICNLVPRPRDAEAQKRLVDAYREVFGKEDESTEIVLADLAQFCGFYSVPPPGTPSDTLHYEAGQRSAYGRIFHFLSMPQKRVDALERAAREESDINQVEGYL